MPWVPCHIIKLVKSGECQDLNCIKICKRNIEIARAPRAFAKTPEKVRVIYALVYSYYIAAVGQLLRSIRFTPDANSDMFTHTCAMQEGESKRGLFTRSGTLWVIISAAG